MIITIGSEKGGVGKSRLATHIAALAVCAGYDAMLLDTDKGGSSTSFTRIRNTAGHGPTIPVFSLPEEPTKELVSASGKYDLIVVDIGAQYYRTMMDCSLLSDLVLVPCGADQQEVESTLKVFDDLKRRGSSHERGSIPAHVVLTRMAPRRENKVSKVSMDLRNLFQEEGISVFDAETAYRAAWFSTGKRGLALHELKGRERSEPAELEMQAVFDEVQARISGKQVRKPKKTRKEFA